MAVGVAKSANVGQGIKQWTHERPEASVGFKNRMVGACAVLQSQIESCVSNLCAFFGHRLGGQEDFL